MAQVADGSEAITVVIEKLTEMVNEGSSTTQSHGDVEAVKLSESDPGAILKPYSDNSQGVPPLQTLNKEHQQMQSEGLLLQDGQQYSITIESAPDQPDNKENDGTLQGGSTTQQIFLNLPAGFNNLNTADPQALLHTLMQMTSSEVVGSGGPPMHYVQTANPANGVQFVETIGAELVIPAGNVFETSVPTEAEDGNKKHIEDMVITAKNKSSSPLMGKAKSQQSSVGGTIKGATGAGNIKVTGANGNNKELLKCAKCDYTSHNKHYLKQHVDLVHNADRPFKCPFCDYAGKRSHSLKEHLVVHSTNRPFECPICNASFRKKGHLTNHVRLHNTFKYFECTLCQKKYQEKGLLYSHLRTDHDPAQVYECKVCEYATTVKSNIVMHMHTHGNPEVYRCSICSFTALHINILKQHMQATHAATSANLYRVETRGVQKAQPVILLKCSVCGYTTDKKETLQNHMWCHLPDGTVTKDGSTSTTSSEADNANKVENNPGSMYKCTECSYSCSEAYLFITHMLAHHPRQKLIADQQKQKVQAQKQQQRAAENKDKDMAPVAFTHDSAAGMYRCTICGYMCEQQRTIKAHIWKHSGHKDIDYPMFQNGPLSVYDDTPVGKAMLLSESSKKPLIKVIPRPATTTETNEKGSDQTHAVLTSAGDGDADRAIIKNEAKKVIDQSGSELKTTQATSQDNLGVKLASHEKIAPLISGTGEILQPVVSNQPMKVAVQHVNSNSESTILPVSLASQLNGLLGPNVRLLAPIHAGSILQPVTTKSTPASSSPEIVQLILQGSGTQQQDRSTDASKSVSESPATASTLKRKITVEHANEKDALVGVAKRLCLESEVGSSSSPGNVVVQQMSQIYTTPTITIASTTGESTTLLSDNHSLPSSTEKVETDEEEKADEHKDSSELIQNPQLEESMETETETMTAIASIDQDSMMTIMEVEVETKISSQDDDQQGLLNDNEEFVDVEKEEEVTLVKLLKKGPNYNPSCPGAAAQPEQSDESRLNESSATGGDTDPSDVDSENAQSEEGKKSKKGICSSLLAVIEQLRERSKSETGDNSVEAKSVDGTTSSISSSEKSKGGEKVSTKSGGTKRKSRRSSAEDDTPIDQYQNVERIENIGLVIYRCKLCHYSSSTTSVIKNHMRLHKTKQPFECSLCDYHAGSSEALQEHMLQHCKVRTYHCKVCTAVFNYKSQLRAHMRAHNEKEPFLCDLCDFESANPIAFRNHGRVHAGEKKGDESMVFQKALKEGLVPVAQSEVEKSLSADSSVMDTQKDLKCNECGKFEAENATDLQLHIRTLHPTAAAATTTARYKCDQCETQCATWSAFSAHLKMHLEARTLKCELCDFVATSMRSLKSHMKRHINDQRFVQQPLEQYKCNLCGYVCHHLPSLKSHMWRHASDKNYSYQITNDVINAAIDYDVNPTVGGIGGSTGKVGVSTSPTTASGGSPSGSVAKGVKNTSTEQQGETLQANSSHVGNNDNSANNPHTSSTATSLNPETNQSLLTIDEPGTQPSELSEPQKNTPAPVAPPRPCLVTFRCCQCGFESLDKLVLNNHMKSHLDIIRKTLEVNKSRLVARAMKEIVDKESATASILEHEEGCSPDDTTEENST